MNAQPAKIKPTMAPGAILIASDHLETAQVLKQATEEIDALLANPQLSSPHWWTAYNKQARRLGEAMFVA